MVLALVSKLPYPSVTASARFHINNGAALTGKQVRWPVSFIFSAFFKACGAFFRVADSCTNAFDWWVCF
jgi:hypothetical protein